MTIRCDPPRLTAADAVTGRAGESWKGEVERSKSESVDRFSAMG
jgi:hypothetical protein